MSLSISGKTAIVTGAANGIGLAIARHLVDKGANVMFADIDEARLESEVGDEARAEGPVRFFAGDLTQKLTIANLLSSTIDAFERVDILVNASRRMALSDPLTAEDDAVDVLLQQNLLTALRLTQMTARRMIQAAEKAELPEGSMIGSIINVSSIAARLTRPELLAYSISTAAIEQMTRSMALALAPRGIRVNAVAFGCRHPAWPDCRPCGSGRNRAVPCVRCRKLHHGAGGHRGRRAQPVGRSVGTCALSLRGFIPDKPSDRRR
jgi:7-alpha-hydroxysteroid dehydrogenase